MTGNSILRVLPLAAALAMSCGAVLAQTGGTTGTGSSMTGGKSAPAVQPGTGTRNAETNKDDQLAKGDRKFIQEAAESGMFEVQAAQLAASKASDAAVKSFASMLVDHHTAANNELVQLANQKKVELPAAPPRSMRREVESLGKKSGKDFDEKFVRDVGLKAHEKDIRKFEKAQKDVKDSQLKAWVTKTLPVLKEHYAAAEKLPQSGKSKDASAMGHRGAGGDLATTPKGAVTGTNTGNKTGS